MIQNLSFLRFKNNRISDNIRDNNRYNKITFNIKITNINFTTWFQDQKRI